MTLILHLLRCCWTETETCGRALSWCNVPIPYLFTMLFRCVLQPNFQHWNITFTIYNSFWRHMMLIDYTFMTLPANLVCQIFFRSRRISVFQYTCCEFGKRIKVLHPSFITFYYNLKKFGSFWSIGEFSFEFVL